MFFDRHKIFKSLEGNWSFAREIDNKLNSVLSGSVIGAASFISDKNDPNILHYTESGEFRPVTGSSNKVSQEYFYSLTDTNDIEVYFASGGVKQDFFHVMGDNSNIEDACLNDTYKIAYDFAEDNFTITYKVKGPNKDYRSHTTFKRTNT